MIETLTLFPGVTLRCYQDTRFKQGRLSLQLVRPMIREEAAMNALLPTVLLRGTQKHPDLRSITMHLDDLYGASVGDMVRRIGDYQTTGFYCGFTDDRFALSGDRIFERVVDFLRELLLEPALENGVFRSEFVRSEKKNLMADMDAQKNDKSAYAARQLMKTMCSADSFSIPRLGEKEQLADVTEESLYRHYRMLLSESHIEIFYVGSENAEQVASLLRPVFADIPRNYQPLLPQTPFRDAGPCHTREEMDIAQSRLCMGFVTDVTNQSPEFATLQVFNTLFGGGMTSKLFMNVREKMSLCYSIGSGGYGSKGMITVMAGIDADKETIAREEILRQLQACKDGDISQLELTAAKEAVLSGLRAVMDSPGAIEGYFATAALSGIAMDIDRYRSAVAETTLEDVVAVANRVTYHSDFFLKGVGQ